MSMFRRAPLDAAAARQVLANWGAPEAIPDPPPQKPPVVSGQSSVAKALVMATGMAFDRSARPVRSDLEPVPAGKPAAAPAKAPVRSAPAAPPQKPVVSGQSSVVNGQGTTDKGRQAAYVSLAEAAERLSCAPKTLERWLVAGKIPGFKMGRRWRVRLGEVEAVLRAASGRNGTPRA